METGQGSVLEGTKDQVKVRTAARVKDGELKADRKLWSGLAGSLGWSHINGMGSSSHGVGVGGQQSSSDHVLPLGCREPSPGIHFQMF